MITAPTSFLSLSSTFFALFSSLSHCISLCPFLRLSLSHSRFSDTAMASSSSSSSPPPQSATKTCFFCTSYIVDHRQGWPLREGGFAELCDRCASAYEEGTFCNIFHSNADGWRDCRLCGKMVHCGCIMSVHLYGVLDFGGISCKICWEDNNLDLNQSLSSWAAAAPEDLRKLGDPSELELSDCDKVFVGINYGAHPVTPNSENTSCDTQKGKEKSQGKEELLPIGKDSTSVLTKLFDKSLTASDTDPKLGRLIIPKVYAKAYFPKIQPAQGFPVDFQDERGHNWTFHFRCWANNRSKMYVLEGLKDYMLLMEWQVGDTVSFYWMQPEEKWAIGTRKGSTVQPSPKKPPSTSG